VTELRVSARVEGNCGREFMLSSGVGRVEGKWQS
jgi:hypothetical protein